MTDKEKIRAEIERRLKRENEILWNAKLRGTYASPSCEYNLLTLTSIRDFIDSLPEEPDNGVDVTDFCKPIDPGIAQCIADHWWEMLDNEEPVEVKETDFPSNIDEAEFEYAQSLDGIPAHQEEEKMIYDAFKSGAIWQKLKMTEGAVEGEIIKDIHNLLHVKSDVLPMPTKHRFGDRVKILILKDDEN